MDNELPKIFAQNKRAVIIIPAGCGKTEIIAKAISYSDEKNRKQLILTHTHAGVKSIYDRLKRLKIPSKLYHIDTIDGFTLQYASAFPVTSGLGLNFDPSKNEWEKVHKAALKIASNKTVKNIILSSFCGVYVDEYQDCTLQQHAFIMALAAILPCRIVGDPLQGIFDIKGNQIVNWYRDVLPNFERINIKKSELIPWRWETKNKELGEWLLYVREQLKTGAEFDLRRAPKGVTLLFPSNQQNQIRSPNNSTINCFNFCKDVY